MRNRRTIHASAIFGANMALLLVAALAMTSCGSSGNTITSPSTLSKCAVTVGGPGSTVPASGGGGSIDVRTERECQWTAQPEVAWVSITAGSSGQGSGTVQFTVAANGDPATRTGGVMVNGQRAQVTQAAGECKFELSSNATSLSQAGGSGSVDVRASSGLCTWTATSDVEWISVTSNASGKGSASVGFTVASTTGPPRAGTLTIAGIHFTVTQSEGCSYAISPSTFSTGAAGGSQLVTVTTGTDCPWTASSNVPWLMLNTSSGSGNGSVSVAVAPTSGPSRSGTLTIARQTVTVTQAGGCTFSISPGSQTLGSGAGSISVAVTAPGGCSWNATSNAAWIGISSGGSGSGNGTVQLTIAANTGSDRNGTATIAGQTFNVVQTSGCSFTIAPTGQTIPAGGGAGSFTVNAALSCIWTATPTAPWISITSGSSGNGPGTVQFAAAANTSPSRTGTITVGGQTFTITQETGCVVSLTPTSQLGAVGGGAGSVAVATDATCTWTAVSGAAWIVVTSGGSGAGNGTVQFTFEANLTGMPRSGTITIGGQAFTINQAGS